MTEAQSVQTETEPLVFAPGARVVIRDEEWIVKATRPASGGAVAVECTGLSELVRNKQAIFLTDLDDVIELKPEDTELVLDPSPQYRRTRLYLESLLRRSPPVDNRIYIGHRAAMDPAPYQLVPAFKALDNPRPRILIADGVGLGKTLEVGILLSELIRRGRGQRILVVALKSILAQFQEELWSRFTIPLVRLDSVGIQRLQRKIPSNMNPFYYYDRAIISIDTLKKDGRYQQYLEACQWDAVVIDECQNVAVRGGPGQKSQRARLANLLARTSDALIMTSATPHDGSSESFASLMHLLDPTAIADPTDYNQEDIKGLYVRRFKKDVAHQVSTSFRERAKSSSITRTPQTLKTPSSARSKARTFASARASALFRVILFKAFLSSPAACISTIDERLKRIAHREDENAAADRLTLGRLRRVAQAVDSEKHTKFWKLRELLAEAGWEGGSIGEKVVVFSERVDTLEYLKRRLHEELATADERIALFYGATDDQEQQRLVKDFGTEDGKVGILLCSDVASEGINLHYYCHRMVHFDLPWSLITLEQRNGRIDRFGQHHTPEIHYLLTTPGTEDSRGDLRVLERLIEKEAEAHKNLGDAAWLMNLHDASLEEDRIIKGMSLKQSAEEIIPDDPGQQSLLDLLLGTAEEDQADEIHTAETQTLFDDLHFAQLAFEELQAIHPETVPEPDWHDEAKGMTVYWSEDLETRIDYLPPELRTEDKSFRLTTDRSLVQKALVESRQDEGRWPEWQLFWDLHPVAGWLNDRLLGLFDRHEASVVTVNKGLRSGEVAYVFQGVFSNARSQPRIVDWFGVIVRDDEHRVLDLAALLQSTGLAEGVPNTGAGIELAAIKDSIPRAVELAAEHMFDVRAQRSRELLPKLKAEQARVRAWHKDSLQRLETKREAWTAGGTLRADLDDRLRQMERDIEARFERFGRGINENLRTIARPYLRLTAVMFAEKQ